MLAGYWQNLKINVVSGASGHARSGGWRALARYALEPAGYNSPELLLPLLTRHKNARLVLIENESSTLMALPYVSKTLFDTSLSSPLLASGVPHVATSASEDVLTAFMKNQREPFLFKSVPSEGKFFQALKRAAPQLKVLHSWRRAALLVSGSFDAWLAGNFDNKRRKEFKRLRNRLGELGDLKLEVLQKSVGLDQFIRDLLELEASGWKGKRGTALKNDAGLHFAFRSSMINLDAAGKLRFWRLSLDGKPIAILYAIVEGDQAWLGKIAFDEQFAKFSPGVMIILDATESFFAETNIQRVDSSAIPNHPMIDRIWRDRIEMVDVLVANDKISAQRFDVTVKAWLITQKLRSHAKSIFYQLMKRRVS
jgi:CelD/BcsL family acetyltransferase involved in cellulose biosynthesis